MELIKVYCSISLNEVNFVKSLLEASGIEAVIFDEAIGSIAPHYLFGQGGARVMVREQDQKIAGEIVKDYEEIKND